MIIKKMGIFGGTFDPVHMGHLRAAEEFAETMELDRVLILPSAVPPHREDPPAASAGDRLEMLRLAVKSNKRLEVSDLELRRPGPSYTLDTVEQIRTRQGPVEIFLALGADAYAEIATWHRPDEILSLVHVVVLTRPGFTVDLPGPLPEDVRVKYEKRGDILVSAVRTTIRPLAVTDMDISASRIRRLVGSGRSIRYLVPEGVSRYIREKGLYAGSVR